MRKRIRAAAGLACVVAATLTGCGGSGDNVEVFPVKGTVTFEGKPMTGGGSIAFIPTAGQQGKSAGGIINEDGTYVLSTYGEGDGSMAGEFRVLITQIVYQEPEFGGDSDAGAGAAEPEAVSVVPEEDRIPTVYSDPTRSPLTATVEAKELNEINFDLKRQPGR